MTEQNNSGTSAGDALDMAVGTSVVAALVTDTVDKPVDLARLPPNCLNCGAPVQGRYCIDCGQTTDTHVPTLAEVIGDAITSIFNLDSRLWRTVLTLFFHPGRLTEDFLAGKRARYVPPLRLYLVISVLLFLITSLVPDFDEDEFEFPQGSMTDEQAAEIEAAIDAAAQARAEAAGAPPELATADAGEDPDVDLDLSRGVDFERREDGTLTMIDADGNSVDLDDDYDCNVDLPGVEPGNVIAGAFKEACERGAADDFRSILDAFVDNIPLLAFLVIPVMAVVFKVFYLFSRRNYLAHLVFLCHTHAFTFLLVVVLVMLDIFGDLVASMKTPTSVLGGVLFLLYMPAYYFLAMRRVYGQGRLFTFAKQLALTFVYLLATTLVFSLGFTVVMLVT